MDKEREIKEMSLLIVDDILLGHNAEETAKHLVNKGYDNVKQAVREFAERLKQDFFFIKTTASKDAVYQFADSQIDRLLAEVTGK